MRAARAAEAAEAAGPGGSSATPRGGQGAWARPALRGAGPGKV